EKMESADFDSWLDYFEYQADFLTNHEVPVLWAWRPVTEDIDGTVVKFERNPYYWQVDPEGNQLPYIDEVRFTLIEEGDMSVMQAVSGELDFQSRHLPIDELPTLVDHEDQGEYRTYLGSGDSGSALSLMPNQNIQDDTWKKELYQNKRFRHALSLAINREELNEMQFLGLGTPRQASPLPQSPFYSSEWEEAYVEYDPEKAIEILEDELGLTEKNNEGYRVRPDNGETLRIIFDTSTDIVNVSSLELIQNYFENIGLETIINTMDRTLYFERTLSGDHDIAIWVTDRMLRPDLNPRWWAVLDEDNHHYAPLWGLWAATDGEQGEEPPEYYKRLQEIRKELPSVFDIEERKELMAEVADIMKEQIHIIGTVGQMPHVYVINKDIKNIPEGVYVGGEITRSAGYMRPQNLFFDN
ncbi:MAG: ABC transporter substrate-binding protein, partial [bacterium]